MGKTLTNIEGKTNGAKRDRILTNVHRFNSIQRLSLGLYQGQANKDRWNNHAWGASGLLLFLQMRRLGPGEVK